MSGKVSLFPIGFQLEAYKKVFQNASMWYSLVFTIGLTVVYTMLSMILTVLCAYPPFKKEAIWGKVDNGADNRNNVFSCGYDTYISACI